MTPETQPRLTTFAASLQRMENQRFRINLYETDNLILLAEIDAFASSLSICFDSLPREAQARALELERHLSGLRRRIA